MAFKVSQSTLDSLDWGRVAGLLRTTCRTPQGRLRLEQAPDDFLFEDQEAGVRQRLAETTEARGLIDRGNAPPFGGCRDIEAAIASAEKGGVLEAANLLDIGTTLEVLSSLRQSFVRHSESQPALAALASEITLSNELESEIRRCLDSSGEVRDAASAELAKARRELGRLGTDLKRRIERALAHADVAPHLSDSFYTVRGGRFVLPVKADARRQVRGIVHDASRSGTTIYVEPEETVELNNQHRQAELTVERETLRVLRDLSAVVAREAAGLRNNLERLADLDLALARGQLSYQQGAVEPRVEKAGIFELGGLRHPLLPADECVANDLRLGDDFRVLILSGPNAGGKTVALKSVALAALLVRAGMHVPANPGARVDLVSSVLADIGDHQDIQESLSTFSAAMAALADILREAGDDTLVCLDEIGVGTDPSEGAAIAQATLETLADSGARTVTTTHYNLLKEMAEVDDRFCNASVEIDPVTLAPTYRVRIGAPGASSATTVAARMGMPTSVLERAASLLDREDRRLDRMLAELSATRATLETELQTAQTARIEGEKARAKYSEKLARLQERRDKLFGEMREELDESFREAHSEVARVIAALQRAPSSRRAATTRQKLESLRSQTALAQVERGIVPEPTKKGEPAPIPIDWPKIAVGDSVRAPGGSIGRLLSLPDRKGRVMVQVAGSKLTLDRDRLSAATGGDHARASDLRAAEASAREHRPVPSPRLGGIQEVDLRGLRVEEAVDRLEEALDSAAANGRDALRVIHGIGTGALRSAVRERLPHSAYVLEYEEAARDDGGAGATRVLLKKDVEHG